MAADAVFFGIRAYETVAIMTKRHFASQCIVTVFKQMPLTCSLYSCPNEAMVSENEKYAAIYMNNPRMGNIKDMNSGWLRQLKKPM